VGVVVFGLNGLLDLLDCSFKKLMYTKCKLKEWNSVNGYAVRIWKFLI
jgi:hypothetical protein